MVDQGSFSPSWQCCCFVLWGSNEHLKFSLYKPRYSRNLSQLFLFTLPSTLQPPASKHRHLLLRLSCRLLLSWETFLFGWKTVFCWWMDNLIQKVPAVDFQLSLTTYLFPSESFLLRASSPPSHWVSGKLQEVAATSVLH